MTTVANRALLKIAKRAEAHDPSILVETFVQTGSLITVLNSPDHQIVYGRRGTGKTHALTYVARSMEKKDGIAVFVDLRTVGSNGSIYGDTNLPISERATRLLLDTVGAIHDQLTDFALAQEWDTSVLIHLDFLADQITKVKVVGEVEHEATNATGSENKSNTTVKADLMPTGLQGGANIATENRTNESQSLRRKERGIERVTVHFGALNLALTKIVEQIPTTRLWILLDEWSAVPPELQPYLADLLRRAVFPVPSLTVKIGAIEKRSRFILKGQGSDYLGIELGTDASADMDLDDFMVFGNDKVKSQSFFQNLFHKHVLAVLNGEAKGNLEMVSSNSFLQSAFTQTSVFEELVVAAEGVPRDAINISALAAQKADDQKISMNHVREAARTWYQRDKATNIPDRASKLLHWIVDQVIGERRARAFLLEQGSESEHPLIGTLFDLRVLHILKRGISAQDKPGRRYDVYGLDYGCYVDLLHTQKEPLGLFELGEIDGESTYEDVPKTDYRSIRRAILDLNKFEQAILNKSILETVGLSE